MYNKYYNDTASIDIDYGGVRLTIIIYTNKHAHLYTCSAYNIIYYYLRGTRLDLCSEPTHTHTVRDLKVQILHTK